MIIKEATDEGKKEAIKIAKDLKEWFNETGIKNIKTDFELNNVIIATEKNKVIGFLCYTSYCGKMLLIWMGVKRDCQKKGIGKLLLNHLEKIAKNLNLYAIEVETLPEEDPYEPYKKTREFYYKNGFKRIEYKKARFKGWDDQILMEKKI